MRQAGDLRKAVTIWWRISRTTAVVLCLVVLAACIEFTHGVPVQKFWWILILFAFPFLRFFFLAQRYKQYERAWEETLRTPSRLLEAIKEKVHRGEINEGGLAVADHLLASGPGPYQPRFVTVYFHSISFVGGNDLIEKDVLRLRTLPGDTGEWHWNFDVVAEEFKMLDEWRPPREAIHAFNGPGDAQAMLGQ